MPPYHPFATCPNITGAALITQAILPFVWQTMNQSVLVFGLLNAFNDLPWRAHGDLQSHGQIFVRDIHTVLVAMIYYPLMFSALKSLVIVY